MKAIVYTSNTGFTAHYAMLLGESTSLPVYSLPEAKEKLDKGAAIIYLGWLMAGQIKGFRQAARLYNVTAVCAVGMGKSYDEKIEHELRHRYGLAETPVFVLQGGFDKEKISGVYKFMMNTLTNTMGKKLENKPDRTEEESDMLDLMLHGGDRVKKETLDPVLEWLQRSGL